METKKQFGSERVQPDSLHYLAIERARQAAFLFHPKGMTLTVPGVVEAPDRGLGPALRTSPSPASARSHVTALIDDEFLT